MNCTTITHFWLWSGSGAASVAGDHVRCQCGAYTYGEWHSLRKENARLTALVSEQAWEIERLRVALIETGLRMNLEDMQPCWCVVAPKAAWRPHERSCQQARAALAARGGGVAE